MDMDAKTLYWTAAWINMIAVVAIAGVAIRQASRGRYALHRSLMLTSAALVGAFVLSYALKLLLLGRETLETWAPRYVNVLRVHEVCILFMLIGGGIAFRQAWRLHLPRSAGSPEVTPDALARGVRLHRRAGFVAVTAAALGVLTAGYVLQGMYARLP